MGRAFLIFIVVTAGCIGATTLSKTFGIPEELHQFFPPFADSVLAKIEAAQLLADQKNGGLVGGIIGALICGVLPLAVRRVGGASVAGIVLTGTVLGAAGGSIGGIVSPWLFRYLMLHPVDPFVDGILTQLPMTLGIALALAGTLSIASIGRHSGTRGAVIVLGLISAVVYPFAASVAFPLLKSHIPIPEGMVNRGLWLGLPILLYTVAILRADTSKVPAAAEANTGSPQPNG
jgi:hypothetical protein